MRESEPEAFDLEYQEEIAWLQGQALELAEQEPDGMCPTCRGTGEVSDYEDVCGDGGSWMQVWGPCPDCIENGRCPVCGGELDENEYCLCTVCGFEIDEDTLEVCRPMPGVA